MSYLNIYYSTAVNKSKLVPVGKKLRAYSYRIVPPVFKKSSYFQVQEIIFVFLNQSLVGEAKVSAVADYDMV